MRDFTAVYFLKSPELSGFFEKIPWIKILEIRFEKGLNFFQNRPAFCVLNFPVIHPSHPGYINGKCIPDPLLDSADPAFHTYPSWINRTVFGND
jgi:hypothetical protein